MIKYFRKTLVHSCIPAGMTLLETLNTSPCFADTPMNIRIPEGNIRRIECSVTAQEESLGASKVFVKPGTYHYNVWIPKDYYRDKDKHYPVLFIAAPGGNAGMENVEKIIAGRKWIAVMLVESKNDSERGMAEGNFLAAHDDAVKRFRLQEGMKFATGLSGGARRQSLNAGLRSGFAGIILQGAGFVQKPGSQRYYMETFKKNPELSVYGIFGTSDPNRIEAGIMDALLPKSTLRRFARFNGGHEWAPPEQMEEAIDWVVFNALMKLDISGDGAAFLSNAIDDAMTAASQSGASRIKAAFALNDLAKILELRNLKDHDSFKMLFAKTETILKKLSSDQCTRNELDAKTEYETIAAEESSAMGRKRIFKANSCIVPATEEAVALTSTDDGKPDPDLILEELSKRYDSCAKKYPGTFYGRKAVAKTKIVAGRKK